MKERSHPFLLVPSQDPQIYTKKTVWMQRISDYVRTGSDRYIQGETALEKVPALVARFEGRYVMNRPRAAMQRARERGQNTAVWKAYYPKDQEKVLWVLLANLVEEDGESWRDAKVDRIEVPIGLELVRQTRKGSRQAAWTWRYRKSTYEIMKMVIVEDLRQRRDFRLRQMIYNLHRTPGFAGTRVQVKELWKLLRAEWKRSRGSNEKMPELPKNIGYLRRLPDVTAPWSEIMREWDRKRTQDSG